jgi:S1-C subfamily serine protease
VRLIIGKLARPACWVPALLLLARAPGAHAAPGVREAMVKIYAVHASPNYDLPWAMLPPRTSNASGCIIGGNLILTNAHAVANQTYIEVRRHGVAEKYPAKVRAVSHTADLALLAVGDPGFFEGATALELGALPEVQSEVVVYGFPTGGDALSSTRGVLSRVEHRTYAHSSNTLLAAQIDAAVNPGNSGGPVLAGDRVIGVVMQSLRGADNIGYVVPAPVIRHFLDDLADGRYDGFPIVGFQWQTMENDSLRRRYGLAQKQTGVLVNRVIPGSPGDGVIFPGDVLTAVEGRPVAGDGTVEIRPDERTSLNFLVQDHQIGESLAVELLRAGRPAALSVALTATIEDIRLVPLEQYDVRPSYFVYGGFVFQPLSKNYLMTWGADWQGEAPKDLVATFQNDNREVKDEQAVLLAGVLPAEVNRGYGGFGNLRIVSVNGARIHGMAELVQLVERGDGTPYTVFESDRGTVLSLDRAQAAATTDALLARYRIPADRSDDLAAK